MTTSLPATVGMRLEELDTPCLLVDLDAFERNVAAMGRFIKEHGVRHRAHAKTHKSSDIAAYQIEKGGACGICCQKVSEAEALVDAGIRDVMVSNEVVAPRMIERLAAMATRARVLVCVDDLDNVDHLSAAAQKYNATIECLVEIDVGAGRCGVAPDAGSCENREEDFRRSRSQICWASSLSWKCPAHRRLCRTEEGDRRSHQSHGIHRPAL